MERPQFAEQFGIGGCFNGFKRDIKRRFVAEMVARAKRIDRERRHAAGSLPAPVAVALSLAAKVGEIEPSAADLGGYLVERFDDRAPGTDGPEYWRGDARLGWLATDDVRLGLGVQGFNDPTRSEFGIAEVRRLVYFTVDLTR